MSASVPTKKRRMRTESLTYRPDRSDLSRNHRGFQRRKGWPRSSRIGEPRRHWSRQQISSNEESEKSGRSNIPYPQREQNDDPLRAQEDDGTGAGGLDEFDHRRTRDLGAGSIARVASRFA